MTDYCDNGGWCCAGNLPGDCVCCCLPGFTGTQCQTKIEKGKVQPFDLDLTSASRPLVALVIMWSFLFSGSTITQLLRVHKGKTPMAGPVTITNQSSNLLCLQSCVMDGKCVSMSVKTLTPPGSSVLCKVYHAIYSMQTLDTNALISYYTIP